MKVSVVYALPERQIVRELELDGPATVKDALERSGLLSEFPEIDSASQPVGVFGGIVPLGTELRQGDRVEIYRPLCVEPKEARIKRARKR
jgi:putative ubiquitin-RnfH superfamily antitoxin RatB of RatAB toxin-antitoxin module